MRRGGPWACVGVLVLTLAAVGTGRAQQLPPPNTLPPAAGPLAPGAPFPRAEPLKPEEEVPETPPPPPPAEEAEGGWLRGVVLTGEYLLLQPRRNALDIDVASPNFSQAPGGTIDSLAWHTANGFRVGAGYLLPGEPWLLTAGYTYLHSYDNRTFTAPPGGILYATLPRAGSIDDVTRAAGSTNLNYNVLDLNAARLIAVSPTFSAQLFGGGRFAAIDQKFSALYTGGSAGTASDLVSSPVYFRGAGLSAGGQGFWRFYRGLGVYARGSGSLLYGQFRNFLTETINNSGVSVVDVREKYYQVVPVAELGLGLAYQGDHLLVSVGYQVINWFGMVNSPDFISSSNIGIIGRRLSDLSLQGLAVQLGLLF